MKCRISICLHCLYFHTSLVYVTSILENVGAPTDCEWNEWQIGKCSKTCGGGTRSNYRTKKVEEMHGGFCEGESTGSESCFTQDCPGSISDFNIFTFITISEIKLLPLFKLYMSADFHCSLRRLDAVSKWRLLYRW